MRGTDADTDTRTMRDDLEAALAEVEDSGSGGLDATSGADSQPEVSAEAAPSPTAGVDETPEPAQQQETPAATPPTAGSDEINQPAAAESKDSLKAPVDWSPKEREDWSRIPRHLQDKIMKREQEITDTIANTRQARQAYDGLRELTTKYGSVMAAEGVNDPMQAISGLFESVAGLRMGSQQDKATIVANMIQHYGVDLKTLDGVLSAQVSGQPAPTSQDAQLQRMLDERMAPVNQLMRQLNQQQAAQQQQVKQDANNQIQQFSQKAEFLNDVRHDMADLIDLAAKRGYNMPLAEAYSKACMANPEIVKVMSARQRQAELTNGQTAIQQKQNAASSISGQQIGTGDPNTANMSIRDQLMAAWNDTER